MPHPSIGFLSAREFSLAQRDTPEGHPFSLGGELERDLPKETPIPNTDPPHSTNPTRRRALHTSKSALLLPADPTSSPPHQKNEVEKREEETNQEKWIHSLQRRDLPHLGKRPEVTSIGESPHLQSFAPSVSPFSHHRVNGMWREEPL